mmetsp:Transcript_80170/g.141460  ORF Transcript_80170/g.141460 Transcript_80170/m.141460 type:complete len:312 (-) Transcript_80170:102-1037(-)
MSSARVVVGLGLTLACTTAFVAPSASQGQGRLRASRTAASQPTFGAAAPEGSSFLAACALGGLVTAAAVSRRAAAAKTELKLEEIPRPEDNLDDPRFPLFLGTTSGYMSSSTKERHAITWTAPEQKWFEMPIGGWAVMNKGENLCYFRRKEQCICLGKQLRGMKINNYKVYRLKADGEVMFMHPADGVFPDKVNKGRVQVNGRPHTIGQNPSRAMCVGTKYEDKPYETDYLTTLFLKARMIAFTDYENLFALPMPNMDNLVLKADEEEYKQEEYTTNLMEALKRVQDDRKRVREEEGGINAYWKKDIYKSL